MLDLGMRHAADKADSRGRRAGLGLRLQRRGARAPANQQQAGIGQAFSEQRHGGDQVVEPLVIVETADEADYRASSQPQPLGQRGVARRRRAEQRQVDPVHHQVQAIVGKAARYQIVAQPLADREDRIGPRHHPVFERPGQPVFQRSNPAHAIAHRRIFPEGADLVDHRNAQPPPGTKRGHAAQGGRMGVENIGPPFLCQRHDRLRQPLDLAPFGQPRRAARAATGAVEDQPLGHFDIRPLGQMAQAGDAAHLETQHPLRLHDRAGAEGVAAVQRQRMIEHV